MDYPNNFDIPTFPAGKTVAFSRSVGIWISIAFFLIVSACFIVMLGIRFKKNYPFLISVDPYTEEWTVVAHPSQKNEKIPQYQIIQEKLVRDFITNWFEISANREQNELRWENCSIENCNAAEQFNPENLKCALSCRCDSELFETFSDKLLPEYRARIDTGKETWTVDRMLITPDKISESVSHWQFVCDISSNINGIFKVLGFIDIDRNVSKYPITFGYYIKDFNAYRIVNE